MNVERDLPTIPAARNQQDAFELTHTFFSARDGKQTSLIIEISNPDLLSIRPDSYRVYLSMEGAEALLTAIQSIENLPTEDLYNMIRPGIAERRQELELFGPE